MNIYFIFVGFWKGLWWKTMQHTVCRWIGHDEIATYQDGSRSSSYCSLCYADYPYHVRRTAIKKGG